MNKGLLDTDILSDVGKGINPTVASNATTYRRAFGFYTLSTISVMEVVRGFQRASNPRRPQAFLASIAGHEIIPFDRPAAELVGRIAGDLQRTGQSIGVADPMIAAIAIHHGLESATGNAAHFQRIHQLWLPADVDQLANLTRRVHLFCSGGWGSASPKNGEVADGFLPATTIPPPQAVLARIAQERS